MDKATAKRLAALESAVRNLLASAPRHQHEEAIAGEENPEQKQGKVDARPPVLPDRNPPQIEKNNTKAKWYNPLRWWKPQSFEWWKHRIELVGLAAGVGYAIVTFFQWRDLRHNFEVDERSWISVETQLQKHPNEIPRNEILIELTNIGKIPADKIQVAAAAEVVEREDAPLYTAKDGHVFSFVSMLFPTKKQVLPVRFVKDYAGTSLTLTDAQVQQLANGSHYLAVYGQIAYSDQFGDHWIRFCDWAKYIDGPDNAFNSASCARDWNAVGDGPIPDR